MNLYNADIRSLMRDMADIRKIKSILALGQHTVFTRYKLNHWGLELHAAVDEITKSF